MVTPACEVAVVGAGIVGLAAACELADAGVDVRCFERAEPGSGQSAGRVRVFRHMHDRADLVALVAEARAGWDAWSERAGAELVGGEGVLSAAPDAGDAARLLGEAGVEHRWVDEAEQRELLPILAPPLERALFDVRGGAIRVPAAIRALAVRIGTRLERAEVLAIRPDGAGAELVTSAGLRRCDRVLVCAGVETPRLVQPLGVEIPLAASLHLRLTFPLRDGAAAELPCWLDRTGVHGSSVYSSPVAELGGYAVGLAAFDQREEGADAGRVCAYVRRALPGLVPEPAEIRPCWLTVLPWHGDAFALWRQGPVLAFAGHNLFKLAPVLGRLLAGAARSGSVPAELRPPSPPAA
jgi:sarcosine oxidase